MTGSRLHQGFEGHLVKSRARVSELRYNLIYDGDGGKAVVRSRVSRRRRCHRRRQRHRAKRDDDEPGGRRVRRRARSMAGERSVSREQHADQRSPMGRVVPARLGSDVLVPASGCRGQQSHGGPRRLQSGGGGTFRGKLSGVVLGLRRRGNPRLCLGQELVAGRPWDHATGTSRCRSRANRRISSAAGHQHDRTPDGLDARRIPNRRIRGADLRTLKSATARTAPSPGAAAPARRAGARRRSGTHPRRARPAC